MDIEEKVSASASENNHPEEPLVSDEGEDNAPNDGDSEQDVKDAKPASKDEDKADQPPSEKEEEEEEESEEEDEDDEKEPPVPLLERPPQTSGRRERKTVERYVQQSREESKRGAHLLEEGSGQKLGDCPVILHNIATGRPDDVRVLHQIIFARPGRPYEFRKNLRAFRGFAFTEGTPGFEKKKENIEKYRLDVLRSLSKILDLDKKSGTREELALGILQFLCDPKPSGREVKKRKKKRKSKGAAGSAKKAKKAANTSGEVEDSGSEDSDEEKGEDVGSDDDEEGKEKPKKKKATPKKTPTKKTPVKKTPGKASAKKPAAKKTPKKRNKAEVEAGSDSEDDEPLVKKPKAIKPPTDNDIKALVRKLLDGANLEEVTMKNILTKVYAKYPDHDLTTRKDFIKTTVKSLIS